MNTPTSSNRKNTKVSQKTNEGLSVMPAQNLRRTNQIQSTDDGEGYAPEDSYNPYLCPQPPKYIMKEVMSPNCVSVVERQPLVEIPIEGEFDENMAENFERQMKKAIASGHNLVLIRINSPGGSVYALNNMLNTLELAKQMGVICATMCTGIAMSCGSIMLAMGTKGHRYCGRHARILLHEISGGMRGKQLDMENELAEYCYDNSDLFRKIARNAGIQQDYYLQIVKKMHKDLFIHPARAKFMQLVDHIDIPYVKRTVIVKYELERTCEDPTEEELKAMIMAEESDIEPLQLDIMAKIDPPKVATGNPFECKPRVQESPKVEVTKANVTNTKTSRLPVDLF